ncbi:outer membrane transport energization protein ExbB [Nitrosospira sp. Nsp5]|uniref:Outer membrane transport energization protein ExbB n=2 Tax=Nitrosomonadaceae TaxID=206379 RepID=A0ABY0T967_9PROT|nr:outer membrane transport energization protein ExbB [Nitrosospira sp. Nsp5]SDQ47227.1 outer membrane transport energization protein ExbB [Nitrosospira multiformis]
MPVQLELSRIYSLMNKVFFLLLALHFISFSPVAGAYWDEAWPARAKITLNPQGGGTAVDQVPVAVRLHSGNFNFLDADADGADLRFVASDDKTELKFHIEKFDSINELAVIWVLLPQINPADKSAHFWLYYGNEAATSAADNKSSWDSGIAAVFHFSEKALLQDASANGLAATGEIAVQKAALLGAAAVFNEKPLSIHPAPALKLGAGGNFSYSAWIKPGALPQQAVLYRQEPLSLRIDNQKLVLASGATVISGGEIKAAAWQHVAVTATAGKATLYVNGAPVGTGDLTLPDAQGGVEIGAGYTGELDEIQIANVARGEDWFKLAAAGQGMDSQLLKIGKPSTDGEEEDESVSYFGILFQSLTVDAWVVIIILAVMFAISLAVMVVKGKLVVRTDRGNRLFLDRFANAGSDDLLTLDENDNYPDSTLFHLYGAGLREIRKRYTNGNELTLTGASIDAIKASIDANLIRENKKLNANMVLLTIAISGGPFLGLLGTVVGVMITFAAIAAAGDVNVNAIAPGIAAALLATVAGLAVAIPALFGYNYLASRIKNITTDMQIFVDEFVTRVAELYGR